MEEDNQVNNKMKVRDNKEVTGGTKRVRAMDNINVGVCILWLPVPQ